MTPTAGHSRLFNLMTCVLTQRVMHSHYLDADQVPLWHDFSSKHKHTPTTMFAQKALCARLYIYIYIDIKVFLTNPMNTCRLCALSPLENSVAFPTACEGRNVLSSLGSRENDVACLANLSTQSLVTHFVTSGGLAQMHDESYTRLHCHVTRMLCRKS